jgi:sporulation protein YlmC with PRC-barrel domain
MEKDRDLEIEKEKINILIIRNLRVKACLNAHFQTRKKAIINFKLVKCLMASMKLQNFWDKELLDESLKDEEIISYML